MEKKHILLFGFDVAYIHKRTGISKATIYRHAAGAKISSKCVLLYHQKLGISLKVLLEWGSDANQLHAPA